ISLRITNTFQTDFLCIFRQCVYRDNTTNDLDQLNLTNNINKTSLLNNTYDKWIQMPQECRYTQWTDWSSCSTTCGQGIQTRVRERISSKSDNCQKISPELKQQMNCLLKAC
ncbi:unnamed protein product, partial [Schistosoma margrebowiei]